MTIVFSVCFDMFYQKNSLFEDMTEVIGKV
jgi:hypothetical protein